MQTYFSIKNGKIISSNSSDATIRVFSAPNEEEKQKIIQRLNVDSFDLAASIDPDEISRVEFEKNHISIIWKQPHTGTFSTKVQFDVLSIGFFIHENTLIMITREDDIPFSEKIFDGVQTINDVILRYFFYTTKQYLSHLKAIKQAKAKLETKLSQSMENKYFLQMFDISESLVYYIDAIEANGAVLSKILANSEKIKFTNKQIHFLEDTISENAQSGRQAQIYSTVL